MKPAHIDSRDRLIVALDLSSVDAAEALIARLRLSLSSSPNHQEKHRP